MTCTVQHTMKAESGGMHQSVFKGLRSDKEPMDCMEKAEKGTEI